MDEIRLPNVLEFEWDEWNSNKILVKHKITNKEAEEPFLSKQKHIFKDIKHSANELRNGLFGKTKKGKLLFISFTVREKKIRIISARPINRKEVQIYEKAINITKI